MKQSFLVEAAQWVPCREGKSLVDVDLFAPLLHHHSGNSVSTYQGTCEGLKWYFTYFNRGIRVVCVRVLYLWISTILKLKIAIWKRHINRHIHIHIKKKNSFIFSIKVFIFSEICCLTTDTDSKTGYDIITKIIFYFHISFKIALPVVSSLSGFSTLAGWGVAEHGALYSLHPLTDSSVAVAFRLWHLACRLGVLAHSAGEGQSSTQVSLPSM